MLKNFPCNAGYPLFKKVAIVLTSAVVLRVIYGVFSEGFDSEQNVR